MSESKKNFNLTRRKFMAVSSAAIAAPFVMKNTGTIADVEAADKKSMKSITPLDDVDVSYPEVNTYEKYYAYYVFGGIRKKSPSRNV